MKIGILGTGMVGVALANKALSLGHDVMMGARLTTNEKAAAWAASGGDKAHVGDMATTAAFGEIVIFAVQGASIVEAAKLAGADTEFTAV